MTERSNNPVIGPIFGQLSIYTTFNLISGTTLKPAFMLEIDVFPTAMLYVKMVRTTVTYFTHQTHHHAPDRRQHFVCQLNRHFMGLT